MRFALLSLFLALATFKAAGQARLQRVIIYTIESTYKKSQHGKDTYYWIIPVDSLNSRKGLSPLLGESFSASTLKSCCAGEPIAPSIVAVNTNYDFPASYYASLDSLAKIIAKDRKRIQKTNTQWQFGQAHNLKVFATPIIGIFCSAKNDQKFERIPDYNGRIYIPLRNFKSADAFWLSEKAKLVVFDFSTIHFDVLQNLSRKPWSK